LKGGAAGGKRSAIVAAGVRLWVISQPWGLPYAFCVWPKVIDRK